MLAEMAQKKPTDFLKSVVGHGVVVKLNSGVTYRGPLTSLRISNIF